MKSISSFFIVFFFFCLTLSAQNYWIPDSSFRARIKQKHPTCFTSQDSLITSCPGVINDTALYVGNSGIHTLDGLQFFSNLKTFLCYQNAIDTLPYLPPNLRVLECQSNQIRYLSNLPSSLKRLNCNNNNIAGLLSLAPNLTELFCEYNQITGFPVLPNTLTGLSCNNNLITSLPSLPAGLIYINCYYNLLTYLPPIPSIMTHLFCYNNLLDSLPSSISNSTSLRYIYCDNNNLTTVPSLPASLSQLVCRNNNISVFPNPLGFNGVLACEHNNLTALPPSASQLHHLYCSYNPITALPTQMLNVRKLYCDHCQLTSLPNMGLIEELNCSFNQIDSLNLLPSTLSYLDCSHNLVTNISDFPLNLGYLDCSYNQLSNLPTNWDNLSYVYLNHNNFTNLNYLPSYILDFNCAYNPISCLPFLPASLENFNYSNTLVSCIPNVPSNLDTSNITFCNPPHPFVCSPLSNPCGYSYTEGWVFIDYNGDGIKDSSDIGFLNGIYFPGFLVQTDSSGFFRAVSDTGNVTFQVQTPLYYTNSSPNPQSVLQPSFPIPTLYFGFEPIPNIRDLFVNINPHNRFRSGFKVISSINYQNIGTETLNNVVVKYVKSPLVTTLISTPAASGFIADTVYWNIGTLNPFEEGTISLLDSVSATALGGSVIDPSAIIEPVAGDSTPLNNRCVSHEIVWTSFDPNDKTVTPDFIDNSFSDYLEYTIRFQNTGNDTAFTVILTDTLSSYLDISSIETITASHTFNFQINNRVAKWYFANILLPDSNVNEAASHGFVKFKAKLNSGFAAGDQINNKANIYFDYNIPVITNTAVVDVTPLAVDKGISDKFHVYPNPVRSYILLSRSDNKPIGKIQLLDMNGKILDNRNISTTSYNLNVEYLSDGIYLIMGEGWTEKIIK